MTRLAWHFLHPGGKLRTGETAPADGEWLTHTGPVIPCQSGLHASEHLIDALDYIPSENKVVLCRVALRGEIIEHAGGVDETIDELVASERCILWRLDGGTTNKVLRKFARWSARQVLHLWKAPPVVVEYLETGDDDLRNAVLDAVWNAGRNAAWKSARAAACGAARDAVWYAANTTVGTTGGRAALGAAQAAARGIAWASVRNTARDAAWEASWGAGRAAAREAQNAEFERLVNEQREKE